MIMHTIEHCKEFTKNLDPIQRVRHHLYEYDVYKYDDDIDLIHIRINNAYIFAKSSSRDIENPTLRVWNRLDGPAHITNYYCGWYFNNLKYSFEEWLKRVPLSEKCKIIMALKYGSL